MTGGSAASATRSSLRWRALTALALVWLATAGIMRWLEKSAPDAADLQAWLAQVRSTTATGAPQAQFAASLGRAFCRLPVAERARLIESAEFDRTLDAMNSGELRIFHEYAVPAGVCGVLLDADARPEAERPAAFAASVRRARDHLRFDDERASRDTVRALVERGLAMFAALAGAEKRLAAVPLVERLREMLGFL